MLRTVQRMSCVVTTIREPAERNHLRLKRPAGKIHQSKRQAHKFSTAWVTYLAKAVAARAWQLAL